MYYMKESVRKEFDRIRAEATRKFGTSDLTFQEYPTSLGWTLEIRLTIWAGRRVYDQTHGSVSVWNNEYSYEYGNRNICEADYFLEAMCEDYRRNLEGCRKYMMKETERAIAMLA